MIKLLPLILTAHAQRMLCFGSRIMISESEISKGYGAPYFVPNEKNDAAGSYHDINLILLRDFI